MEKDLLNDYFKLSIKQQFNIDLNTECEFSLIENLVSKKVIVAPTFSDQITENSDLKQFFNAMINEINLENCEKTIIEARIKEMQNNSHHLKEIS
ncbi:hypothetical protein [Chryseobacterium echinoideorum]|uniref:hypothetical protein n=1 Tax=Chryseobacterium echinoideorum TaxID=1549648 RepID=UPI001184793D|nr:hypothetical protein [Chryseobacterium echinoideorum]